MLDSIGGPTHKSEPFGTIVACGSCRAALGEVHFASPHGIVRFFSCGKCGAENDFTNGPAGITRICREKRQGGKVRRLQSTVEAVGGE